MREAVLVIDFGSQYSQLITRRIRELGVYSELISFEEGLRDRPDLQIKALILSGGPSSVYDPSAPRLPEYVLSLGVPVLGICYGMHLLAMALGGEVSPGKGEYGGVKFNLLKEHSLFFGCPGGFQVWMSHKDSVTHLPDSFLVLGSTENSPLAAFSSPDSSLLGLQFHPEVNHTQFGKEILANFLFRIAGMEANWSGPLFREEITRQIRERVGEGKVICAVSGGVDSTVVAFLLQQAIPGQFTCLFIDTGLLRLGEKEEVEEALRKAGINIKEVDASSQFLERLKGVEDPEEKRLRIGKLFADIFVREAKALGDYQFLAQGTIYPDVIESRGKERQTADKIKTHHNVGGLPEDLPFSLVEPLRYLFKDEVRELGSLLGVPQHILKRQPFPGPGLAVRIIGEVTPERLDVLKRADKIFREEMEKLPLGDIPDQFFAILTPLRAVGVRGDQRAYGFILALRAVQTKDFMTARWSRLSHDLLTVISSRICNEVTEITRVVYDITDKPPATIEWE